MTKNTFIRQFLKHSREFQQVSGDYNFEIGDTEYILDAAYSGRILLWRDYGNLIAWSEDQDYEALAQMAFDELETAQ
jgi:hypothetical protein